MTDAAVASEASRFVGILHGWAIELIDELAAMAVACVVFELGSGHCVFCWGDLVIRTGGDAMCNQSFYTPSSTPV